nr:PREDICTED: uncharacterized protein LOC109029741 isoform X2 [Bemisia tabaci]
MSRLLVVVTIMQATFYATEADVEFIDDINWHTTPKIQIGRRKIANKKNSLFLGMMLENDHLISEIEVDKLLVINEVIEHTVQVPAKNETNEKLINFIAAIDCNYDAEGQPPQLLSGGINQTHATILLRSSRGKALDYLIHVRGLNPGDPWMGPRNRTRRRKNYTSKLKIKITTPLSTT